MKVYGRNCSAFFVFFLYRLIQTACDVNDVYAYEGSLDFYGAVKMYTAGRVEDFQYGGTQPSRQR